MPKPPVGAVAAELNLVGLLNGGREGGHVRLVDAGGVDLAEEEAAGVVGRPDRAHPGALFGHGSSSRWCWP
jgi:hypothetical protein